MNEVLLICIVSAIVAVLLYFCAYRNLKAGLLKTMLIDGCYDYIIKFIRSFDSDAEFSAHYAEFKQVEAYMKALCDRVSHWDMMMSFKPIKLETWYTPEEIEKIQEGLDYDTEDSDRGLE